MSFQTSALLLSWVAILLLALVMSGLVRQVHALTARAAPAPRGIGLPAGTPAPEYELLAPPAPGPLVLLFAGPDCRTCTWLLPSAVALAPRGVTLRVLYPDAVPPDAPLPSGAPPPSGAELPPSVPPIDAPLPASGALVEVRGGVGALFGSYGVVATPFAVLVDAGGRVRECVPIGSVDALRRLLGTAGQLAAVRAVGDVRREGAR